MALGSVPAAGQRQVCEARDTKTKEALPGVTLTWNSSFRCKDVPKQGSCRIRVRVSNDGESGEAIGIRDLELSHTTPRPRGGGPEATARTGGLPLVVALGETASFTVTGKYELVETDEGWKANLHLRAIGKGLHSMGRFRLGINVSLRR